MDSLTQNTKKLFARQGFMILVIAALLLEVTSLIQYLYSKRGMRAEADKRAQSELRIAKLEIEKITQGIEDATLNTAWMLEDELDHPADLHLVMHRMMDHDTVILNGFAAFLPNYYPEKGLRYEQVLSRRGANSYQILHFSTEDHDYLATDWFQEPVRTGEGYWSEPYFDKDGVRTMVVTYAVPLKNLEGETVGVYGVDVSLAWLGEIVGGIHPYNESFSTIESSEGQIIAMPPETLTVEKALRYTTPLEDTGWRMSLVISEKDIYGNIKRVGLVVTLLQIIGLALLIVILYFTGKAQMRMEEVETGKQKMEEELKIASGIQMSMVPRIFPPFPERTDLDMAADLTPAKEVGGDLYDYYIQDEKLYFCIGDVSGKGVPASLLMAVTRSLFRSESAKSLSPKDIVTAMNEAMAPTNENSMFVTFFCGILDLKTGLLRYCNAGHNAPVLLSDDKHMLPVRPNLPLAILPGMEFTEQEIRLHYDDALFLYTDGLTEAENPNKELFGEERMLASLSTRKAAIEHLRKIQADVHHFVSGAPQSDDLTLLFIHYLNQEHPSLHHLSLRNDIQELPKIATLVDRIAEEKQLDPSLALSLNLALEEAATNVALYAYPEGSDNSFDLEAILRQDSVEFTLADSGKPFDPTAKEDPDITLSAEERPIGGLGIFLVKQIMDKVKYERRNDKNYLRMIKKL